MSNETTVVETHRLTGLALEWAAGKAHSATVGRSIGYLHPSAGVPVVGYEGGECFLPWSPLTDGSQTWELVEAHIKRLGDACEPVIGWDMHPDGKQYFAAGHNGDIRTGATKPIAVCRTVVQVFLGDVVEVPTVLVAA